MAMEGGAMALFAKDMNRVEKFTYKVENDSILFMKGENDKEYNKWAIIKKFSDNYDYLQLRIADSD